MTSAERIPAIAVDDAYVYWAANETLGSVAAGSIRRAPKGGGAEETLATAQLNPCGIAVQSGSLYWANAGGFGTDSPNGNGELWAKSPGQAPVRLAFGLYALCTLRIDAADVYAAPIPETR